MECCMRSKHYTATTFKYKIDVAVAATMLSRQPIEHEARFHDDTNYGAVFICSKYIDIPGKKTFSPANSRESIGTIRYIVYHVPIGINL